MLKRPNATIFLLRYFLHINNVTVGQQVPGVAPLIPGITLPLFAGIAALAVLLVVHEFSHGVLARISKVKIRNIGLVILGIVPMGAYVEPNEKAVNKLSEKEQNRISVVGVASNFVATIVFFVLFLLSITFVTPHLIASRVIVGAVVPGSPSANVLIPGSQILSWNGYAIHNISDVETAGKTDRPYSPVVISTSNGTETIVANTTGKIGIIVEQLTEPVSNSIGSDTALFFNRFFALSLLLNFLVGIVNLLPLPGLDGWRVYKTKIKSKKALSALAWTLVVLLLLNVLPWFFLV